VNRTLWTVIGLVLLAAGAAGLLVGYGVLSFVDRQQVLLSSDLIAGWNRHKAWWLAITIMGGLLVALLGYLLLRAQFRRRGGAPMADLYLPSSPAPEATEAAQFDEAAPDRADPDRGGIPDRGGTEVASRALHRALQRDLESDQQIRDATVRLSGPPHHPRLLVRLAVTADADVGHLASHVDRAIHRFTTTSGVQPDLSEVVVRIPARAPARVE
jgi:hypothetical protein